MKAKATKAKLSAAARRRWARVPHGERVTLHVFPEDAEVLRKLVPRWPDVVPSPALSLRALLAASKGLLWRVGADGQPRPTGAFYGPLLAGVR